MSQRSYDVRVVALTLGVDVKWLDNLLSHHAVPGCVGARQGIKRRITDHGLRAIAAVRLLGTELGIPVGRALELIRRSMLDGEQFQLRSNSGIVIELPWSDIERDLQARLIDALQAAPRVARGRPRRAG